MLAFNEESPGSKLKGNYLPNKLGVEHIATQSEKYST